MMFVSWVTGNYHLQFEGPHGITLFVTDNPPAADQIMEMGG